MREPTERPEEVQVEGLGVEGDMSLESVVEALKAIEKPPTPELITPYPKWSKKELRDLNRKPKKKTWKNKPGRKRLRYWARKKKIREKMQKHYQNNLKWRIMGFTHWERLKYRCMQKKWKLELTEEDLKEMVPGINDMAYVRISRIGKEITVLNRHTVDIKDKEGKILYSGLDAKLRDLGYTL